VIVLGGFMFLVQQIYTSLGSHEAIKYNYEERQESPGEQLLKITVHKIGPDEKGKVKFFFRLLDTDNHKILSAELKKCEQECSGVLFPSWRECNDITQTALVKPSDVAVEASAREFQFQKFPGSSLYELHVRIQTSPDTPTTGGRVFQIIDASNVLEPVISEYPEKMKFTDYLAICRNEFFFLTLVLLLGAVIGVHKLRRLYSRRII
jgi:hypothetical protein